MRNPFQTLFSSSPAHCSLVEDVQDILHTRAWWEEKRAAYDQLHLVSEHSDNRTLSLKGYDQALLQLPCFGSDETTQTPYPETDSYDLACRDWESAVEDFKNTHPAFYAVWDLGQEGLEVVLEGLQEYAGGKEVSPGRWRSTSLAGLSGYFESNPDFETMADIGSQRFLNLPGRISPAQGLFGDQLRIDTRNLSYGRVQSDSSMAVSGAQSGLDNFQIVAEAYEHEKDRGRSVLEYHASKLGAALAKVEEEHGALHQYVLQAEEKYAVAKRVQEESSLGKRLWGEGEA